MKAIKVQIYPTPEQSVFLNRQFGAVRFTYNKGLHLISTLYKRHGIKMNAKHDLKKLLPIAKKSRKYGWLEQFDSMALQQACINLDHAYQRFFNPNLKSRHPTFKRKTGKQSSYHCTRLSVGENWIKIPKLDRIKAVVHRPVTGKVKSITVSKTPSGKYFASILVDDQVADKPLVRTMDSIVGLDIGVTNVGVLSDGQKLDNPRSIDLASRNLSRKQKKLSRKKDGSNRRAKSRLLVEKSYERLANARHDFQHKLSRTLIDENQAVVVEALTLKRHEKNRRLMRHIGAAGWSSLIEILAYKARREGKHLVTIGHRSVRALMDAKDSDLNAAMNLCQEGILKLRAEGLSVPASGGLLKTGH